MHSAEILKSEIDEKRTQKRKEREKVETWNKGRKGEKRVDWSWVDERRKNYEKRMQKRNEEIKE